MTWHKTSDGLPKGSYVVLVKFPDESIMICDWGPLAWIPLTYLDRSKDRDFQLLVRSFKDTKWAYIKAL